MPAFERHVFVCHNSRPADAPRPSCTADGKSELHTQLQQLAKAAGLAAGCGSTSPDAWTSASTDRWWWFIRRRFGMGMCSLGMRRKLWRSTWWGAAGGAAAAGGRVHEYEELPASGVGGLRWGWFGWGGYTGQPASFCKVPLSPMIHSHFVGNDLKPFRR